MRNKKYWVKHTKKAKENFPFEDFKFPKEFIINLALIKAASAKANLDLKLMERKKAEAIFKTAIEISKGKYQDQFPLSIFINSSFKKT